MEREQQVMMQEDQRAYIEERLGSDQWVTVYSSIDEGSSHGTYFCALIPNNLVKSVIRSPSWNLSIGDGMPGCAQSWDNGETRTEYNRTGRNDGIEALILDREFHGLKPSHKEVAEEFRLFHNLYDDGRNGKLIKVNRYGDDEEVVRMSDVSIQVNLKNLRQFLA